MPALHSQDGTTEAVPFQSVRLSRHR